jgi:hypothetical protein
LHLIDCRVRQIPGMIDHGTEVGNIDPAAAMTAANMAVGGIGRRPAQALVEVSAPEVRPHENASLVTSALES